MLIKYMGTDDVRKIEKGDTFAGQLPAGVSEDLEWNIENHWVVSVEDEDVAALVLTQPNMKDVTDLKRVPANEHQKMFLGLGSQPVAEVAPEGDPVLASSTVSDTGTTTGGSTTGGSTRGATGRTGRASS